MSDEKKNLVLYRASAGSGKTYTLVKEFLTLCLKSSGNSYKEILAVTFTNKAANEMKDRILKNLDEIINSPSELSGMGKDLLVTTGMSQDELVNKAKGIYDNILHNYSDFNVSTIDGFVQQLSRSFSRELNLPAQYMLILDDDDLLDELMQRIDKKIGGEDEYLTKILVDFTEYQLDTEDNKRVDNPIKSFIKKLLKESAYKKGELLNIKSLSKEEYEEIEFYLKQKISSFKDNIKATKDKIEEIFEKYNLTDDCFYQGKRGLPSILMKIEDIDNIEELTPSSLCSSYTMKIFDGEQDWFSSKAHKKSVSEINTAMDFVALFKDIVTNYNDLFITDIIRKNLYLYVLRAKFMEIINQYIEETNKVHISEFNKRISDIIGDCSVPFIYERIAARFRHYFIDEFQDTSLLQWFNFLPLVNESLSNYEMNLLVGDAKQAIYRFRSGEVEQIIKLPQIYKKENNASAKEYEDNFRNNWNPKSLDTNYRSKKNIVEFNNSFFEFANVFLRNEDYRSVYQNNMKQNYRENAEWDGYVNVEIFKMEAFEDISEKNGLTNNELYKNKVKEAILRDINVLRNKDFSYKDITILVRNNSDGSDIAEFLTQKNVPVISADSILLSSSDKVMLIVLTLRYFNDESNQVTKLSMSYYYHACKGLSDEFSYSLDSFDETFGNISDVRNTAYSLYDLCAQLIKLYGFNMIEDVFLQYFMNLVQEWQSSENNGIEAFVDYWDRKSSSFFVKLSAEIDAVQIMSIHKSKGLEFKVVMYPYAYTKVPDKFHASELWLSFKDDFEALKDIPHIENFLLPLNKKLTGTDFEHYYKEEYDKEAFDDFNIMYVAMTRPEDALFIYTNDSVSKNNGDNNFFLDYISEKSLDTNENNETIVLEIGDLRKVSKKEDDSVKHVLKLSDDDNRLTINWFDLLKVDADPTMFWADENSYSPQEWGTLVHDILSQINTIDDAADTIKRYVNEGSIDETQAASLLELFGKITDNKMIKDAFSKKAIVRNEMEILTPQGRLRPDRFAELPDKVMLIDYKTGKEDASYYQQLKDYMLALQEMNNEKEIKAYLLYISDDISVQEVFQDRLF